MSVQVSRITFIMYSKPKDFKATQAKTIETNKTGEQKSAKITYA